MRRCEVPGCRAKHKARGMCMTHYHRWREGYGGPEADLLPVPPLVHRPLGSSGLAVSRYTWRGVSCNQLPAVWAAEDARDAAATTVAKVSA